MGAGASAADQDPVSGGGSWWSEAGHKYEHIFLVTPETDRSTVKQQLLLLQRLDYAEIRAASLTKVVPGRIDPNTLAFTSIHTNSTLKIPDCAT